MPSKRGMSVGALSKGCVRSRLTLWRSRQRTNSVLKLEEVSEPSLVFSQAEKSGSARSCRIVATLNTGEPPWTHNQSSRSWKLNEIVSTVLLTPCAEAKAGLIGQQARPAMVGEYRLSQRSCGARAWRPPASRRGSSTDRPEQELSPPPGGHPSDRVRH